MLKLKNGNIRLWKIKAERFIKNGKKCTEIRRHAHPFFALITFDLLWGNSDSMLINTHHI